MLARVLAYLGELVLGRSISPDPVDALFGLAHHLIPALIPSLPRCAQPILFALHDRRTWHVEVIAFVHLLAVEVGAVTREASRDAMAVRAKITFAVVSHGVSPSLDHDWCERRPIRTTGRAW